MPISLFLYLCYNGHCAGYTLGLPANDINTLMEDVDSIWHHANVHVGVMTGCGQLHNMHDTIARCAFECANSIRNRTRAAH